MTVLLRKLDKSISTELWLCVVRTWKLRLELELELGVDVASPSTASFAGSLVVAYVHVGTLHWQQARVKRDRAHFTFCQKS